jgi:hypothetical protein
MYEVLTGRAAFPAAAWGERRIRSLACSQMLQGAFS